MEKKNRIFPTQLEEYGAVLERLNEMRERPHSEAKQLLYGLVDAVYRKGYEDAKKEEE